MSPRRPGGPHPKTGHSALGMAGGPHTPAPHFTECVALTSPHPLASLPAGSIFLRLASPWVELRKSHVVSSPSESPWRIFLSLLASLGWFALWQISGILHFRALGFPAPVWKTHKQRTSCFIVLPSMGKRAAPSFLLSNGYLPGRLCFTLCWGARPRFYITECLLFPVLSLGRYWSEEHNPGVPPLAQSHYCAMCLCISPPALLCCQYDQRVKGWSCSKETTLLRNGWWPKPLGTCCPLPQWSGFIAKKRGRW